ncbi:MAG: ECF transporter S component [Agathobacter sp.]|nr:ECF transporter S component [Agathobacter sp.]
MSDLLKQAVENISFVLVFALVIIGVFALAYVVERLIQKRHGAKEKIFTTRKIAMIGMFSAIAGILMLFEFPLPMIAPPFYELDFSELPVLICGFAFGPVAGVVTEFLKVLIKLFIKSTSTAFVGDLANFVVGCTMILPATIIYHLKKSKTSAVVSCIVGTICMAVFGTMFNAIYLIPAFSKLYGIPLEGIIAMGSAINASISDIVTFVIICVGPLNIIKGAMISFLTILVYKPLSPIIKNGHRK